MKISEIAKQQTSEKLAESTGVPVEWATEVYKKIDDVVGVPICPIAFKLHVKIDDETKQETPMVHILFKHEDGSLARIDTSAKTLVTVFQSFNKEEGEIDEPEFITLRTRTTKKGGKAVYIDY